MKKFRAISVFAIQTLLMPLALRATDYYDSHGNQIHCMERNFPFGMLRGALVVAQGPLEYFHAIGNYYKTQKLDPNPLVDLIAAFGIYAPITGTVACVPHVVLGAADIVTLGLCSPELYSSGVCTPLIWEETGFLEKNEISDRPPYSPPASSTITPEPKPSYSPTPVRIPTSVQTLDDVEQIQTSVPEEDDDVL